MTSVRHVRKIMYSIDYFLQFWIQCLAILSKKFLSDKKSKNANLERIRLKKYFHIRYKM
jgi:hypothetical protein